MTKPSASARLRSQGLPAAFTLACVAIIGTLATNELRANVTSGAALADIAVRNEAPGALSLAYSERGSTAIIDIEETRGVPVELSVPSDWIRAEVRNVNLADVAQKEAMLGFTSWTLPAGAAVRFQIPEAPEGIMLHHPSVALLKVNITLVDLESEATARDIILVQDNAVRLW